ncbi:uncharacterized protein LOC143460088 isoform X2 [Clavelina lepadiformis]|uniref:uncharacterized protein LOC143460088 isoform X2 n=1 Tax=Clavelina lepadiformis TaxID=159417 RepID=UPI004041D7F6
MPRRKGAAKIQKTAESSEESNSACTSEASESEQDDYVPPSTRSNVAPSPRAKKAAGRGKRKNQPKNTVPRRRSDSDEESEHDTYRHRRNQNPSLARIRTIYSQFPKENGRLVILHLFSTFLVYLCIYPVVNLIWTYMINIDDEVATLFHYITEEPTYYGGWFNHVRKMRWLAWPPFTAESVSLLLASAVKDAIVLQWEGIMSDMSLTDLVSGHIARRYRR